MEHLNAARLLPDLLSAYGAYHSTETTVVKVLTDILRALDTGDLALLTLLDWSPTFDMVDHATLLRRLKVSYGLHGHVLGWFQSYLDGRMKFVRCGTASSTVTFFCVEFHGDRFLDPSCSCCILQLVDRCQLCRHLYADNSQIYGGSCHPSAASELQEHVSACVDHVRLWIRSNRIQLNSRKIEVLWCASSKRQHQILRTLLRICSHFIQPASSAVISESTCTSKPP